MCVLEGEASGAQAGAVDSEAGLKEKVPAFQEHIMWRLT